jgi:threonyl-tRNA synthetase
MDHPYGKIRVDIDDREESVGRKIRDAEKEWVPIIIVYGEKEKQKGACAPRFRKPWLSENEEIGFTDLQSLVLDQTMQYPQHPLPLPLLLSKRPKFKG